MRIFIGIKLDEQVHRDIETFLKPFKKINSPIKWVKPQNVHLTIKFIGEVSDTQYTSIEKQLDHAVFDTAPFDMHLTGCGKFGRGSDLNIFWLGIDAQNPLNHIFTTIETALEKEGFPKESRPFKPHITVGRNKKNYNFKSLLQLMDEKQHQPISQLTVNSVQVFKSRLTPEGPIYNVLKEIPLDRP